MNVGINGFMIVRKSVSMELVEPYKKRFIVENKEYKGFQRDNLYEIQEVFYNKKLPENIYSLVKNILDPANLSQPFIENLDVAKIILEYCNNKNDFNEIIAVQFNDLRCKSILYDERDLEWLGYDIVSYNNNSLLFLGLFSKPGYFKEWIDKVNSFGLFDNPIDTEKYIEDYLYQANNDIVEDYILPEKGFQIVKIAKVRTEKK